MKTVYAIEFDPINMVIHAVTGSNKNFEAFGLTFDTRYESFGELIQNWSSEVNDK